MAEFLAAVAWLAGAELVVTDGAFSLLAFGDLDDGGCGFVRLAGW